MERHERLQRAYGLSKAVISFHADSECLRNPKLMHQTNASKLKAYRDELHKFVSDNLDIIEEKIEIDQLFAFIMLKRDFIYNHLLIKSIS